MDERDGQQFGVVAKALVNAIGKFSTTEGTTLIIPVL
jgi:hypothetical protein